MNGTDIDEIPNYPCPVCRTLCHPLNGVFAEGRWYHERCYVQHIGDEVCRLQKKVKRGNITLEEAEELKSLEPTYRKMRSPKESMDIRKHSEPPKFFGNTNISMITAAYRKPKQNNPRIDNSETKLID